MKRLEQSPFLCVGMTARKRRSRCSDGDETQWRTLGRLAAAEVVQPEHVVLPDAHVFLCGCDVLLVPRSLVLARGRLSGPRCSATLSTHKLKSEN